MCSTPKRVTFDWNFSAKRHCVPIGANSESIKHSSFVRIMREKLRCIRHGRCKPNIFSANDVAPEPVGYIMIVPAGKSGFPIPIAAASSEKVRAVLWPAEPFSVELETVRCVGIVPLASGALSVSGPDVSQQEPSTAPFNLNFLPLGTKRFVQQTAVVEHLVITFAPDRISDTLRRQGRSTENWPGCLLGYAHADLPSIAQAVRRHLINPVLDDEVYLEACADIFLAHAINATLNPAVRKADTFSSAEMDQIVAKIDKTLEIGASVASIADHFQLTTMEFSRRFKSTVGCGPQRYIIERRIAEARRLLTESDASISEIAFRLGFSSQAHLTSAFKSLMGVPPGKYRKQLNQ